MDDEVIRELCAATTRDDAGCHFTEWMRHWQELEEAGAITIYRPVHETGIPYSLEYWSLEITESGLAIIADHPELTKEQ